MNKEEYFDNLKNNLTRYFDIELNKNLYGREFSLYGKYYSRNAKYFASKKLEVYSFTINEYILYNNYNFIDVDYINELNNYIIKNVDNIVIRDNESMSSGITLLLTSSNNIHNDTIKAIKKFKLYKSYSWGFKGWVNVKLIFVNIENNQTYSNKQGRREEKRFIF